MSIADQMHGFSWEKRPLKRPRLGPPDLYPQDPKQREDELNSVNVKQGFSHMPQLSDEFGTMKNGNISAAKLGVFINGAISKKIELNALPDTGKRRLQVNTKDHFWHVTPRHKQILEAWMKDLAGAKPLSAIAKKVPIFNKREEIFLTLAEHQVPMVRAAWFLKMTASYNSAISEAKTKKRQMPDPSQEWTSSLQRCCKDILARLTDWYNGVPPTAPGGTPNSCSTLNPERPNMTPNSSQPPSTMTNSPSVGPSGNTTPVHSGSTTGPGSVPSSGSVMNNTQGAQPVPPADDGSISLKQWLYCTDLAKHLYEEGLLDRPEWLRCVIDMCDRTKSLEDGAWKALVPLLLSFMPHISQSESLSRYLATITCRRLSSVFTEQDLNALSPVGGNFFAPPMTLVELLQCPTHRTTVLGLVSALQVITLECPTSLVYNSIVASSGENGKAPSPVGSALDILPIQPSVLPMPPRANNQIIRTQLKLAESQIMARSRAVEAKWSCEEWQQSSAGATLQKVLSALDALDRHFFDKIDNGNSLEGLYSKIFPIPPVKENPSEADAPIVLLLCQWAVGPCRLGEHRALTVAKLLEHRQTEATNASDQNDPSATLGLSNGNGGPTSENGSKNGNGNTSGNENMSGDDIAMNGTDSEGNGNSNNGNGASNGDINGGSNSGSGNEDEPEPYLGLPIYHNLLFNYLDTEAPILDESSPQSKTTFSALVHLFSALIRHDIFSHDAYLCTLVARGDLSTLPQIVNPTSVQPIQSVATPGPGSHPGPGTPASVSSVTPSATPHHDNVMDDRGSLFPPLPRMQEMPRQPDYDDRNIDDDLDRILQHITQEQQNNMDQIDSPKEDNVAGGPGGFGSITSGHQQPSSNSNSTDPNVANSNGRANNAAAPSTATPEISKQSRHRLYVTHFPLPQDDTYQHEANQRHILLYGVGRARDEARHIVKKVSKDLGKLFSKKFCYDVADGSRVKKHSKNEINLETLQTRFNSLPYFDQHSVTALTALGVLEMLATFASGRSNYLPTVEHIAYLTELMEVCLNITCLVETCVQILRELPEIESQLKDRSSPITVQYVTSLQLQLVAVLRRYQCSLLLDSELTTIAWESLTRLMRRLTSATECSSSERCTLAYLNELQSCSSILRAKNVNEYLPPAAAKLRQSLSSPVQPSDSAHNWNHTFMMSCLDNPRRKEMDMQIVRQLVESPVCRYSFVCNAVLSICNEADAERLNDLASLCAEMTAACPLLAPEWLGVLQTLCTPRHATSYADILTEVDVKHLSIHSSLATLTSLLVARHCFSLQDFVVQAVTSLLKAWNEGRGPHDPDTEAGARLTCALLLSLFKTQDNINPNTTPSVLKLICDRRLLSATHNSITLGAVLAVLKAMLLLADAAGTGDRRRDQRPSSATLIQGELSISHILGTSDVPSSAERADAIRGESRTLASFAYASLQQMCGEPWVRQRCLQNPDDLCNADMLLDPIVSSKQAQRLLQLICYPEVAIPEETLEARTHIPKIMDSLDQWNLREAWLALTLQNKQLTGIPIDHQSWLDIVARSALEVFHLGSDDGHDYILPHSATPSPAPGKSPRSGKKGQDSQIAKTPPSAGNNHNTSSSSGSSSSTSTNSQHNRNVSGDLGNEGNTIDNKNCMNGMNGNLWMASAAWLIAPLVAKLPGSVQGRVLRHAGNVLENTLWPKKQRGKPPTVRGGSLHAHLPFLALILTCLRGQDEQREGLLASLLTQFTQLLSYAKDPHVDSKSDALRDALRLRLSLVGGMFDAIQRSTTATQEWAVVLTQLVTHGIVNVHTNPDVFPTVVDMVAALVHSTQIAEPGDRIEEMKKQNMNLVKKLKKELTDRDGDSIKPIRQLLPFSKVQAEVIVCQATSIITDSKGNRVQSFEFVDKKPGLQVWEKQRVSHWEVIEGQRNPAPLSWAWFGAVKMERKPIRYEEAHRLLKYHAHSLVKSASHFMEPVPLPPEEIDVKPEIPIKEEIMLIKPDTPSSDQSPRGPATAGRKPKAPRKKRQTKAQQQAAAAAQQQQQAQQQVQINSPAAQPPIPNTNAVRKKDKTKPNASVGSPYGAPGPAQPLPPGPNQPPPNYPPGPPPQWYNGNQQTYYPPQQVPGGPGRPPTHPGASKQALHNLLRQRQPGATPAAAPPNQFQQFPQAGQAPGPRHQILRSQLRGQTPGPIPTQGFQGQTMPPNQGMYQQQQMQQQGGMNQNYSYNQPPINTPQVPGPGMMTPQQQQMNQIMGPRGPVPVQEMSGFMNSGAPGQVPVRTMGQRPPNFMQGNPPVGPQGNPSMSSMQPSYGRPTMNQMGQGGQMVQGMNNPGQMSGMPNPAQMSQGMVQVQSGMQAPGQMSQQGMSNPGQMGQPGMSGQSQIGQQGMQSAGQMAQPGMQNPGQMGQPSMQNPGQMGQPGMQNPGQMNQPGMQNPGQMGQPGMQNPGQMSQPGMQNPGQMGQPGMQNPGQMGQPGMQNPGQMGQQGMQNPGQMGQPGIPNSGQMGQPGMSNPGQMGQPGMQNPGQMGQPGMSNAGQMGQPGMSSGGQMGHPGMPSAGQMGQPGMTNAGQMGQPGMQNPNQMGQPGMLNPNQMGQPGMQNPGMVAGQPNMPNATAQRYRQMQILQQQQQQQQQNMGVGPRGPMHYANQPGGY